MSLFPLVVFEEISDAEADRALVDCEHYLGPCERPYGRQSFGLVVNGKLASVAVSASTTGVTCAGFSRFEVVELARLGSLQTYRMWTRVALRCWRECAPALWPHWSVLACVSYSNETRHKGDVYRFDGWRKHGIVRGSTGGGHSPRKERQDKSVWFYDLRKQRSAGK